MFSRKKIMKVDLMHHFCNQCLPPSERLNIWLTYVTENTTNKVFHGGSGPTYMQLLLQPCSDHLSSMFCDTSQTEHAEQSVAEMLTL